MPGRDQSWDRNSEYEAYDRNRRELERRGEDRSFDRGGNRGASDPRRLGDDEGRTGEGRAWRDERSGSRFDQDRTQYGRSGGRPDWQDRDWQGGSPGLSYADEGFGPEGNRSGGTERASPRFRQSGSETYGYGGQEYGMEAGGGRAASEFGRAPEPLQRVTDGEDGRHWRDRFGDDGRPHPRFDDDRHSSDRNDDRHRAFGRDDDRRGGWFGRHDDDDRQRRLADHDRERRFGRDEDRSRGQMRWRDDGAPYGDTRLEREGRGMSDYGVPHDYGLHQSIDPIEAEASHRRQQEMRRRQEEDRRRRAEIQRRDDEYRASQSRSPWDRNW